MEVLGEDQILRTVSSVCELAFQAKTLWSALRVSS